MPTEIVSQGTGQAIIFSAPSGAGKTSMVKGLMSYPTPVLGFSVSATTRSPRGEEKEGEDYWYFTHEEFKSKVRNGDFIEWEEVYPDLFYGTLKSEVERMWFEGITPVFDVDVLVGPTVPITAPIVKEVAVPEEYFRLNMAALRNTSVVNLLGLCAVSLPVGRDTSGIPVGFQLIARNNADAELLAISLACESVIGMATDVLGTPPLLVV